MAAQGLLAAGTPEQTTAEKPMIKPWKVAERPWRCLVTHNENNNGRRG